MRQAGVRHACNVVHIRQRSLFQLILSHDLAVAVAHDLDVDALIVGVRIAVIAPEKRADLHVLPGGRERFKAVRRNAHNLVRAELIGVLIAQLVVGERLERYAVPALIPSDVYRQPAEPVARGEDLAPFGQDEDCDRALDHLLRVQDAGWQVVALVDERGSELRGVHRARTHGEKLPPVLGKIVVHQLVRVADSAHGGNGVQTHVRTHEQRLRIDVADAADARTAVKLGEILLKLGAKRRVFDAVNLPLEPIRRVQKGQTRTTGAEVAVVIHAEEHIHHDVAAGRRTKEAAHYAKKSSESVMGSIYVPSRYTRMLPDAISSMSMTSPSAS